MAKKVATKREVVSVNKKYELMIILSPDLRESEVTKKLKELEGMMEKAGGKILEDDFWGKKKLAYRIKTHTEGIYMVYNLELPNTFIKDLKNHFRIEKDVIRTMLISIPDDYVYTRYDIEGMADKEVVKKTKKKTSPVPKKEKKVEEKPATNKAEEKSDDAVVEAQDSEPKDEKADKKPADKPKKEESKEDSELDKKLDALLDGDDLKL